MRSRSCLLIAAALLLAAAPALAAKAIDGSGKLETRTLDLPAFTKVDLGGAFDVEIGFGKTQKVEVTIDDNLWENLQAEVEDGELSLDWDRNCNTDERSRVVITMASLEVFALHGAGDVTIAGIDSPSLRFLLRGAGDVTMDGKVGDLEILLTGAGDCHARHLVARRADVKLSGVGNCEVHAAESLDASVSGVGDITYWGSPDQKNTTVTGMGNIRAR